MTNESNMAVWNAVNRPPATALKAINAGRLKGKTDINPQWRMQALTEQFGPCGIGWKYTIDKLWTENGSADQVMAFALVSLFIKDSGSPLPDAYKWSEPIPGIGGSAMITRESSGMHSNDEAYKMAVTDALSVACKALGVAADIYAGLWDGSKYKDQPQQGKGTITPKDGALDSLNEEEREYIEGIANELKSQLATNPIQAARTYLNTKLVDMEHVALKALLNSRENNTLVHLSKILDSKNMEELRERFSSAPVYIKDMAVQVKDKMKADFEANGKEAV